MTDRELMQQALDALEHLQTDIEWQYKSPTRAMLRKVEKALRARLAEPPCKTGSQCVGGKCDRCAEPEPEKSQDKPCIEDDGCPTEKAVLQRFWREHQAQPEPEPQGGYRWREGDVPPSITYTAPPQRQPEPVALNHEYTKKLIEALKENSDPISIDAAEEFERLLTATPRKEEPEPVAWTDAQIGRAYKNSPELHKYVSSLTAFKRVTRAIEAMKGYTAPPRKEWQGLTDEEYVQIMQEADRDAAKTGNVFQNLRRAIEAKLKEKNT